MAPSIARFARYSKRTSSRCSHQPYESDRIKQIVAMDNLSAHKGERVRKLIEHRGCELLYLCRPTPQSPDLNPIEKAFSKAKHILKKLSACAKEALIEAIGRALGTVSTEEVRGSSLAVAIVHRSNNYEDAVECRPL